MEVTERINGLMAPYLKDNGIELVEMTYKRGQGGMTLRLLVDTAEGVTVEECEKLSAHLSALLDGENIMEEHYLLEVSSPGLDRPIKTDRDFERSMGRALEVTTYQAVDAKKTHEGKLVGMDKENIVLESKGISTVIPRTLAANARLKIEI